MEYLLQPDTVIDAEVAARLVRLIGTRVHIPIQPYQDEGLAEVIFRAASVNRYHSTAVLSERLGLHYRQPMNPKAFADARVDPQVVADLLGTRSSEDMVGKTYPWRDTIGAKISFFGREVRIRGFFLARRRVAPRALREKCYQRAVWSVAGLGFDPASGETLLSRCHECGERPDFQHALGVAACPWCRMNGRRVDFRDYPQANVCVDDADALSFATNLIDPNVSASDIDMRRIAAELRDFGPGQLFRLISGMALTVGRLRDTKGTDFVTPDPPDLANASRAMLAWPDGFHEYSQHMWALYYKRDRVGVLSGYHPMRAAAAAVERPLRLLVLKASREASRLYAERTQDSET